MKSDVNAIAVGYHGKLDMFEVIGYIKRPPPVDPDAPPDKALRDVFDTLF